MEPGHVAAGFLPFTIDPEATVLQSHTHLANKAGLEILDINRLDLPDAGQSDLILTPAEQKWLATIISNIRETADGTPLPVTKVGQKASSLRPPGSKIKIEKLLQCPEAVAAGVRVAGSSGAFVVTLCQQEPAKGDKHRPQDIPVIEALLRLLRQAPDGQMSASILCHSQFFVSRKNVPAQKSSSQESIGGSRTWWVRQRSRML